MYVIAALAGLLVVGGAGAYAYTTTTSSSTGSRSSPPSSTSEVTQPTATTPQSAPVATPSVSPSTSDAQFVRDTNRTISASRKQLATMLTAIQEASQSPADAAGTARLVLTGRHALLSQVQGWTVPNNALRDQTLLEEALEASIRSDSAYARWMEDLATGDTAGANAAYAHAQANDPVATRIKRRFLRALNSLRTRDGIPPLPLSKLF